MQTVVIGVLGTQLDSPRKRENRWQHWRPTVGICQQDDLIVDRYELLIQPSHHTLANQIVADIHTVSPETRVTLHEIDIQNPWDFEQVYGALADFSRAYTFNTDDNNYLFNITTGTHVVQICFFLLTESRHFPGNLVQASPSERRRQNIAGTVDIIDLDLSRYDEIARRFEQEATEGTAFLKSGINTRNARFNSLIERIEQVAVKSPDPILITGPTGAGKSRLAERIHALRRQRDLVTGPFVAINCATLRGDAAMSTLFGHVKGAFTGAQNARDGFLAAANNGVLFLDEIGELGDDEQAMLLHALEEKKFFPMGSDIERGSNFQLIAGTNADLQDAVCEGSFREDLLARINLWTFRLPGLRDRREDIDPNIDFELDAFSTRTGRRVGFNAQARTRFLEFALKTESTWDANFRDLSAAITRMATLADRGRITREVVDEEIQRLQASWSRTPHSHTKASDIDPEIAKLMPRELDQFDEIQLAGVLAVCRQTSSLSEAGRLLFAQSRLRRTSSNDADRLSKYLAKFNLHWNDIR